MDKQTKTEGNIGAVGIWDHELRLREITIEEDRVGKDDGWKNETDHEKKRNRRKSCKEGKFSIQSCHADHRTRHPHTFCPVTDFCLTTYLKRDSSL